MSTKKKKKAPQPAPPPPPRGRIWLFRLAAMLLAPALFLLLLEGGLRLFGYGFSPGFFLEELGALRTNPAFSQVCFPPELARVPVSDRLADPKPQGEYRIFILGASAAQGFPSPAYSFGRLLETMLEESYPSTRFKVVNAAMAAINSHIVLPIAKDCVRREADLLVVYMGNNEVVGPFGPGTVFADFSPNLSLIRASLGVKRARTGQLMANVMKLGRTKSAGWAGMEMFVENHVAADDPRMRRVYEHFKSNLGEIVESARENELPVIVSNLATNLKDSAPFASMHRAGLGAADLKKWQTAYDSGVELEAEGRLDEAAELYRAAMQIDDRYADLHFRLARYLLARGEMAQARQAYLRARELDALRFRADDGINAAVSEIAAGREEEGIYFVDAAGAFAADGIPGEELFDDHVHMHFSGNYLLAREIFKQVTAILPASITRGEDRPPAPSQQLCAQRLVFTEWERGLQLQLVGELTDKPPFTGQLDHDERQRINRERLRRMDRAISPARLRALTGLYESEISREPDDHWLRIGYAQLLVKLGSTEGAAQQLSAVLTDNPAHREALWELSRVLARQGRYEDEARYLNRVLEIEPFFMQARNRQAINLLQRGKKEESVEAYRKLMKDYPGNARIRGGLARVLLSQGKEAEATAEYRKALETDPDFSEARVDLVQLMISRGNRPAAIDECEEWIGLSPDEIEPLLLLAAILERGEDLEGATGQYRKALAIDPRSLEARRRYGKLLQRRGALADATAFHQRMLESDPEIPAGHYLLGISFARQGRSAEAIDELREELKLAPASHLALGALARILGSDPNPQIRDGVAAVAIADKLAAVAPGDPATLDAVAIAYAEFGDFDRAVEAQTQAVQLIRARGQRDQARLRDYMARLQLYRTRTPFRQGRRVSR